MVVRGAFILLIVWVLVGSSIVASSTSLLDQESRSTSEQGEVAVEVEASYIERGPIRIIYPWEFTEENGVVGGTGTDKDPYFISGWKITSDGTSIAVATPQDTHVVISDNWVIPGYAGIGIGVGGFGSVDVINNLVDARSAAKGIQVAARTNHVSYNTVLGGTSGLLVSGGDTTVEWNHFQEQWGSAVSRSRDGSGTGKPLNLMTVRQNNFMENDLWGVKSSYFEVTEYNIADASHNYWGHPDGPRTRVHSSCCIGPSDIVDPREEGGAYFSLGVNFLPHSAAPFPTAGVQQ